MGESSEKAHAPAPAPLDELSRRLAAALGPALGAAVTIASPATEAVAGEALRALLPEAAVGLGLEDETGATRLLLVLDRRAALALIMAAGGVAEEARAARLGAEIVFADEDRTALAELARSLLAPIAGPARIREPDFLAEAVWESGRDPLTAEGLLGARAKLGGAGLEEADLLIVIAPDFAPPAAPARTGAGRLLFYGSKPELAERVLDAAGIEMRRVEDLPDLLRDFGAADTDGAVVALGAGDEHILALIAGLREFPGCDTKSLVVVLEEPSAWNVVRCGRLGIFSVLGPAFAPDDLAKRL